MRLFLGGLLPHLRSKPWLLTSNINAGLSYSERDGISANVGLNYGLGKDPKAGLNLGVSYNRQDGMGASVGLTSRSGVFRDTGANITRTEYSGFGADISSREYGPGKFSGGLSYNQRDGFTASLNVAGTNALNYNSQTGLSSNTDFISQYSMNRGMSEDSNQTDTEAESRAAQERNNQTQGAQAIEGAGYAVTRKEGENAHGAPGDNSPVKSREMSGSVGPDGKPINPKTPGVQADGSISVVGSKTPTLGEKASSLFDSVVGSAKGLWDKAFGRTPNGVYNSAGIEAGKDKVLNSKAAYDPGYEQKGANWTPGKLANGEKYSNISYTETKDANGNSVYQKVYRNYHADGTYTVAGTESSTKAAFDSAKGNSDYRRFTSCNMVNHEISQSFGAVSPFMPEKAGTQYYAGQIYTNLQNGKYNTDTHQYRAVGFQDAEKNASRGGLSIAVTNTHIVTLTGGYKGTQGKASDLNIFQGGASGVGQKTIFGGFGKSETRYPGYYSNGKELQYYVWEKK